ncbi:MAG: IPT/TIG domain-containing protein [Gammaproteobacteria bacterium]
MKTAIDRQGNALIITGRNFGATAPTVTLADQVLEVKHFSEQEVVASLPPGLTAATYGVTVTTNGQSRASSNLFSATLPDADKRTPQGTQEEDL